MTRLVRRLAAGHVVYLVASVPVAAVAVWGARLVARGWLDIAGRAPTPLIVTTSDRGHMGMLDVLGTAVQQYPMLFPAPQLFFLAFLLLWSIADLIRKAGDWRALAARQPTAGGDRRSDAGGGHEGWEAHPDQLRALAQGEGDPASVGPGGLAIPPVLPHRDHVLVNPRFAAHIATVTAAGADPRFAVYFATVTAGTGR